MLVVLFSYLILVGIFFILPMPRSGNGVIAHPWPLAGSFNYKSQICVVAAHWPEQKKCLSLSVKRHK